MSDPIAALRTLVAAHRPQRARDGYPDSVRSEVVRHPRERADAGVSIAALARDVGLSAPTLKR